MILIILQLDYYTVSEEARRHTATTVPKKMSVHFNEKDTDILTLF